MNLPLPKETREYFGGNNNRLLQSSNLGLLLNKYVSVWTDNWKTEEQRGKDKVNLKAEFLAKTARESFYVKQGKDAVESIYKRQLHVIQGLQSSGWHIESFYATTDGRLIIGLGSESVIETGMTLHPLYGFPYLPASGLKGLARAYAEVVADASRDDLLEIFGSRDKVRHSPDNRQGSVFFMDGLPVFFPKLDIDIMNPHYGEYYQGDKPPADYLNPVPVTFLTVAEGQTFLFTVYSREKALAEKAREWLAGGLTDLGAGGKTNVGYGYFREVLQQSAYSRTNANTKTAKRDSFTVRFEKFKASPSAEKFMAFVESIKQEELASLECISFEGMESVINIGIVQGLENIEVQREVLRSIARKILEIVKPKKKWNDKKRKSLEKLRVMASR